MKTEIVRRTAVVARAVAGLAIFGASVALTGCTTSGFALNGGTTTPPTGYAYLTGNWVFQTVPTAGSTPFSSLAGYVDEQSGNPGVNDLTTAALQAQQPSSCYLGASLIPLQGALQAAALGLRSFSVNAQFVTINATKDATATHLTGTYSIDGGCAGGAAGTITGTKYNVLTGTYAGSVTGSNPAQTLRLSLSQNTQGSGEGLFLESGSAVFNGFSCFSKGTLSAGAGTIIGNTVALTFTTDDPSGAKVILNGSVDSAADVLTISSGSITGGGCAGSLAASTLTLQ
ncbi:hypothetical protein [Granulicella tundricola]|nr:hypothetical protein [Granulicella tundricola]